MLTQKRRGRLLTEQKVLWHTAIHRQPTVCKLPAARHSAQSQTGSSTTPETQEEGLQVARAVVLGSGEPLDEFSQA